MLYMKASIRTTPLDFFNEFATLNKYGEKSEKIRNCLYSSLLDRRKGSCGAGPEDCRPHRGRKRHNFPFRCSTKTAPCIPNRKRRSRILWVDKIYRASRRNRGNREKTENRDVAFAPPRRGRYNSITAVSTNALTLKHWIKNWRRYLGNKSYYHCFV